MATVLGYSGSDLQALCEEAAMMPIRELGSKILTVEANKVVLLNFILLFVFCFPWWLLSRFIFEETNKHVSVYFCVHVFQYICQSSICYTFLSDISLHKSDDDELNVTSMLLIYFARVYCWLYISVIYLNLKGIKNILETLHMTMRHEQVHHWLPIYCS